MSTLMSRGLAMLARSLQTGAGVTATYARGATSFAITPWVGRTGFGRTGTDTGPALVWGERDYLIPVADLTAGGVTQPQKGDRITEVVGGVSKVFEVVPPEAGEPAWRFADQSQTMYRLHVQRVT